jgi:hypothetical protein
MWIGGQKKGFTWGVHQLYGVNVSKVSLTKFNGHLSACFGSGGIGASLNVGSLTQQFVG